MLKYPAVCNGLNVETGLFIHTAPFGSFHQYSPIHTGKLMVLSSGSVFKVMDSNVTPKTLMTNSGPIAPRHSSHIEGAQVITRTYRIIAVV